MSQDNINDLNDLEFPPVIPGTAEELSRAVTLLGNRAAGPLTKKPKRELIKLVGAAPIHEAQAAKWKFALKTLVKGLKKIEE
jgi:hypothetical protein